MINNRQQSGRRRGRGGQRPQGNPGRPEQGNRIDNRARGNASQLLEKYKTLARDAQTQGDRVMTEYYLQFADHYFRVLSESRARFEENRRPRDEYQDDEDDGEDIRADSVSDIDFGDRDRVDQDRGEPRRERPRRDDREPREAREPREQREPREVREPREARESREQRDTREVREPREPREQRETREPREQREIREPRAPREAREPRERRPRQEPVQAELAIEEQPVEVREERAEARPSRGLRPRRNGTTNGHDRSEGDVGIDADRLPPSFGIRVEESAPETVEAEPEPAPKPRRGRPRKVVEAPAAEG